MQDSDINSEEQKFEKKDDPKKIDKFKGHPTDITDENCPFQDDEILTFVNIRFPGNAKAQPFLVGKHKLSYRQKVMAMSDRGITVGYVNSLNFEKKFSKDLLPIRKILRIATDEDIQSQKDQAEAELRAENICLKYIEKYNLNMTLTHVEIIQFGKKAVFYFNAPERVDFRELVKSLVSELKMRIELRQINVRDRSAAIGAIGACGRQNCCSSFLNGYGNVSIKMAKNQNLALLPSKINGVCGQLKCCLRYEDDVYSDKRDHLPEEGFIIKAMNGDIGKVLKLYILPEEFMMLTDKGQKRRYTAGQYAKNSRPPRDYTFPENFEHIVDETSEIIGKERKRFIPAYITNENNSEQADTVDTVDTVNNEELNDTDNSEVEKPTLEQDKESERSNRNRRKRPRGNRKKTNKN